MANLQQRRAQPLIRRAAAALVALGGPGSVQGPAAANDLGEALDYAREHFDRGVVRGYEPQWRQRPGHEAVGMLSSRDVTPGRSLDDYDCLDSAIDTMPIMRSSSKEMAALRGCLVERFARPRLPGYRTLGRIRLDETRIRPAIETNAAAYEVPAVVLLWIMKLSSGLRPHAISDQGHVGLMQLRPDLLRAEGVAHHDLLQPEENVRAGAAYLRALVFKYGGLRKALLAYADGGTDMTYRNRTKRWFVNFTMSSFYGANRKFPYQLGAENVAFVWSWLQ